ncbi:MAG: hypothetical protein ACFB01_12520 [Cohaesibacteraceae bacterium]|mgnify:CR=1 FL=1
MRISSSGSVRHFPAGQSTSAGQSRDTRSEEAFAIEETSPAAPHHRERRSSENLANAQALRLGLAAQMLTTRPANDTTPSLPVPPAARGAARYATTAQGVDQAIRLGFIRTI